MPLRSIRRSIVAAAALLAIAARPPTVAAEEAPLPVLLVHGWHGIGDDTLDGSSLAPLGRRLAADGHSVAWASGIGADVGETLPEAASALGRQVAALGRRSGQPVVIVAHSYGGIVARAYLEGEGYAGDFAQGTRVAALVTLGTPMAGIDLWLPLLFALGDPLREPSVWQLTPAWMGTFNQVHRPRPDVRMVAIAGDARSQAWPLRLLPASDGVVTLASALALDGARFGHDERITSDVHAPSGPFALLGWHDFMSHAPTYRDAIRPALRGLGEAADVHDGGSAFAAAPGEHASAPPGAATGLARGPVVLAGDAPGDAGRAWRLAGALPAGAALFVAAPSRGAEAPPAGLGEAPRAHRDAVSDRAADPLGAAIAAMDRRDAFDAGLLPGAAARAAVLAPAASGDPALPAIRGAAWFAAYPSGIPHPELSVTPQSGGVRATLSASDGRPLAASRAWIEVVGAEAAKAAWFPTADGELAAEIALPPGSYAVRAGVALDGRDVEALVTASVPDPAGAQVVGGSWCPGAAGTAEARAEIKVAEAGRFLIAVRALDGDGRTLASTAGWRKLDAGPRTVALAAMAAGRPVERVAVTVVRDGIGLVPSGEGVAMAGSCARVAPALDGSMMVAAEGPRR